MFFLALIYIVANFILNLVKRPMFTEMGREKYKVWKKICLEGKDSYMHRLVKSGTKKLSFAPLGRIKGYCHAYAPEPEPWTDEKGDKIDTLKKELDAGYEKEKKLGLDSIHLFLVKSKWWKIWQAPVLYLIPNALLIDSILSGDIFVACGGFHPVEKNWRIPSNLNIMRYTNVIRQLSIDMAYSKDWDMITNIGERATAAQPAVTAQKNMMDKFMKNLFPSRSPTEAQQSEKGVKR